MNRVAMLSCVLCLAAFGVSEPARSDVAKKLPTTVSKARRPLPRLKPDKLRISKLQVAGDGGLKAITLEISNPGKDSALWTRWELWLESGGAKKYLGVGSIAALNGGQSKTMTFQFAPPAGTSTLEAVVDPAHQVETDRAEWSNNAKSVSVSGSPLPNGVQVMAYQPSLAAGLVHEYVPRASMPGCSKTESVSGPTISINFTCTAMGTGELTLFKGYTLNGGYKVNTASVGSLGGGTVQILTMPAAGSAEPAMSVSINGNVGAAPLVFATLDVVGPSNQSPY
jgi:hypothetical protein